MFDDVVEVISARVETNIMARIDELKALVKEFVADCATKQCVNEMLQTIKEMSSVNLKRPDAR